MPFDTRFALLGESEKRASEAMRTTPTACCLLPIAFVVMLPP